MNEIDYKTAYENVMIANKMLEQENKQLKDKIDKAIEYIKYLKKISANEWNLTFNDLLEILGDKE